MIGYGENHGIVPIATDEIFKWVKAGTIEGEKWFEVQVSMLEIYNECVQDLLTDPSLRTAKGLSIRESKNMGVFVNGLSKHAVNSYEAIQNFMEFGNKNRSIGST